MTTITPDKLALKFRRLEDAANKRLVERRREVRTAILAILARAHHLQVGGPGEAKSLLPTTLMSHIGGAKYAEFLFTKFSTPEEVYGPLSVAALEEDRYVRKTELYAPWADFVFFDEAYKGSSALLNANLWFLNERKIRNDGKIVPVPLCTAFLASNELPEGGELAALDDRIEFRRQTKPIQEQQAFILMLKIKTAGEPQEIVTMDEIRAAHDLVDQVDVPDDVFDSLAKLRDLLKRAAVEVTDRRFYRAVYALKAAAFLDGRNLVDVDDIKVLRDVLWTTPDQQVVVQDEVLKIASELDHKAMELGQRIEQLAEEIEDIVAIEQKPVRIRRSVQQHTKLEAANEELIELQNEIDARGKNSDVALEVRQRLNSITRRLLADGFKLPNTKINKAHLEELLDSIQEIDDNEDQDEG